MKKLSRLQKILLIAMIVIVLILGAYVATIFISNKKNSVVTEQTITYGYSLYERDNDLYREVFNKLKDVLTEEDIDYDLYAEYITELFVIDFYTLNNKNSKTDIGGIQYLYSSLEDNFILNAENTIYKYISSLNELPEVSEIELLNIEESIYEIDNVSYDSYIVKLEWSYVEDYGYDTSAIFTLIKEINQLYIVEESQE